MSVLSIESSAITKSVLKKGYNGDCLNLNGRVTTEQETEKGFRASGNVKPPYYCAMASCPKKNISLGMVTAFADYTKGIKDSGRNAKNEIEKYFDDMKSVAKECGTVNISQGMIFADNDRILCASSGNIKIFRFSGVLEELKRSPEEVYAYENVTDNKDGDIFIMLGGECSFFADVKEIENIIKEDDSVKSILQKLFISVASSLPDMDCSVVVVRVASDIKAETPVAEEEKQEENTVINDNEDVFAEISAEKKSGKNDNTADDMFSFFGAEFKNKSKKNETDYDLENMNSILGIEKTEKKHDVFNVDFSEVEVENKAEAEDLFKGKEDIFNYDDFIKKSVEADEKKKATGKITVIIIAVLIIAVALGLAVKLKNNKDDAPVNDYITLEGYSDDYTKKVKNKETTTAEATETTTKAETQNNDITTTTSVAATTTGRQTSSATQTVQTTRQVVNSTKQTTRKPVTQAPVTQSQKPTTEKQTEAPTQPTTEKQTETTTQPSTRRTDIEDNKY